MTNLYRISIFLFLTVFLIVSAFSCNSPKSIPELPENPPVSVGETSDLDLFKNEGLIKNAADPFVFKDTDGTYYLYHTGKGFPVYTSKDLVLWTSMGKSMPGTGYKWAEKNFWAPEVVKSGNKYYLHYTSAPEDGILQIGMAIANTPLGPFVDVNNQPFYETGDKGILDSHLFFDEDGKVYMYFSNAMSTNTVGDQRYSEIWVIEVNPDLSGVKGTAKMLIKPEQTWEYNTNKGDFWNEGAVVVKKQGIYYLMYSANCFCAGSYSVGYATSENPLGPFVKYANNPVLSNEPYRNVVSGPGHHSVTSSPDGKEMIIVYHSHMDIIQAGGDRQVNIDRMGFRRDGTLYVSGPTVTVQPVPASNSGKYRDISGEATISSTSTLAGSTVASLNDGEFSMYPGFMKYEWIASSKNTDEVEISFLWTQEQKISELWIYNSIDPSRQVTSGRVVLNNGDKAANLSFRKLPGEATLVKFSDIKVTNGFRLYLKTTITKPVMALSEVNVFAVN